MRVETIGDATLYCGDCFEILPTLSGIQAVVTDPPYGLPKDSFNGRGKSRKRRERLGYDKVKTWDTAPDLSPILALNVPTLIWGGNHFALPATRNILVWDKGPTMYRRKFAEGEIAWCSFPGQLRMFQYAPIREIKEHHPTQKPLQVMRHSIEYLPKECSVILDPFMGSGSTGVAAFQMGKSFIGIEKDEEYFEIACKRIRETQKQPDMFLAKNPKTTELLC